MRSPLVQQWAGILAITAGFALFSYQLGLIVLGLLVLVGGVGRELEARTVTRQREQSQRRS